MSPLGGKRTISPQQRILIEQAVRTRLFLQNLDTDFMRDPRKVTDKELFKQRQSLAYLLVQTLRTLGMEHRKAKELALEAVYEDE